MANVKFASKMDRRALVELRRLAASSDRTMTSLLTEAVNEYVERARLRPAFRVAAQSVLDEHAELLHRLAK